MIAWRGNRQPWRIIVEADDLIPLLIELEELRGRDGNDRC
jgi:hypothetical protein